MSTRINPPRTPLVDGKGYISPEWYRFLSSLGAATGAEYLTVTSNPQLSNGRVLGTSSDLTGTAGTSSYTLGLADTTVVPGTYGTSGLLSVTVDQKGRITGATSYSVGAGLEFVSGSLKAKAAGTYGAPSGTLSRASLASYAAGTTLTFGVAYSQAEHNALAARLAAVEAALQAVSQLAVALITDLRNNGNLT